MRRLIIFGIALAISASFAAVNINTADLNELTALKGIGEAKAKAIIEHRNTHGEFKKIEDIMQVKGIGEKLFKSIEEDLSVSGETDLNSLKSLTGKKESGKDKSTEKRPEQQKKETSKDKQSDKKKQ